MLSSIRTHLVAVHAAVNANAKQQARAHHCGRRIVGQHDVEEARVGAHELRVGIGGRRRRFEQHANLARACVRRRGADQELGVQCQQMDGNEW